MRRARRPGRSLLSCGTRSPYWRTRSSRPREDQMIATRPYLRPGDGSNMPSPGPTLAVAVELADVMHGCSGSPPPSRPMIGSGRPPREVPPAAARGTAACLGRSRSRSSARQPGSRCCWSQSAKSQPGFLNGIISLAHICSGGGGLTMAWRRIGSSVSTRSMRPPMKVMSRSLEIQHYHQNEHAAV